MEPIDAPDSLYAPRAYSEELLQGSAPGADPDEFYEGDWAPMAGAREQQTESVILPPPEVWEPIPPSAGPTGPALVGHIPPGPPPPHEPEALPWTEWRATSAARPHVFRDGLAPPAYESRGGRGAGRYSPGASLSCTALPGQARTRGRD